LKQPSLFLIGAPKSGTTAIAHYLSEHPEILFSEPKEPKYFHTDFNSNHRLAVSEEDYWSLFGGYSTMERYPIVAEATVWYLYSQNAVANILRYNPCAKFLVMVRNPVDLAHSLHAQLLYGGDENVRDFEAAWSLREARRQGEHVPPLCRDPKSLRYSDIAKTGEQLLRLYQQVDSTAVRVGVFDDLVADPRAEYQSILRFLRLQDDGRSSFPIVNRNRTIRFHRLALALGWASRLKQRMGIRRSLHIWRASQPLVSRTEPRTPLTDRFRKELNEWFAEDVSLLSKLLDRDLGEWTRS
jgi:hypothetical protein